MLSDFPTEILAKILSFLPLKDVLRLSSISSEFCIASELVYTRRRNQICGQHSSCYSGSSLRFDEVRQLLFSNYGFTVGLWKIVSTIYGGLLEVKFDGYQLVGIRFFPPPAPHTNKQLQPKKIFIINIDGEGKCECICFRGHKGHPANIVQSDCDGFQLDCNESEIHQHQTFVDFVKQEMEGDEDEVLFRTELLTSKYNTLMKEVSMKCLPLQLPQRQESAIIQPGLFKGSYSAHGVELVLLTYDDEDNAAVLTKITGDPNIPAGQVTIIADLNAAIPETQESGTESDASEFQETSASGTTLKRYRLPRDVSASQQDVPEFFKYKYFSNGQIAMPGYVDASFVKGQWVIFDDDTFGHIWLCLESFATFKRITETFCTL